MNRNKIRKNKRRVDPFLLLKLQASTKPSLNTVTVATPQNDEPKGLKDVKLHPLLLGSTTTPTPETVKNPFKASKRGFNVNPYLDPNLRTKSHRRDLKFNDPGKFINKAIEIRETIAKEHADKLAEQELKLKGLYPIKSKGEHLYQLYPPPSLEWWDQIYLKDRYYNNIDDPQRTTFMEFSDENPITHYIQFPQLPKSVSKQGELKLYLTKQELKKKRRVERLIKHKTEQEQIRAGLLPPPPPKIKLKNIMNVLTNDLIKDPTLLELKVKQDIKQRQLDHERMNQERKLTPEEKSMKLELKQQERLQDGVQCAIFKLGNLSNAYKVNVNAAQMKLRGCTLSVLDEYCMIIVEGDYKNINKFTKLLLNRIDWGHDKEGNVISNYCDLKSTFKQGEFKFSKWHNKNFNNDEELINYLTKYEIENYIRLI